MKLLAMTNIFLVTLPWIVLVFLFRLQKMHNYFHAKIINPWREAIEKGDWDACRVYDRHAQDHLDDMTKLLLKFWRKLPQVHP